jgi:nitric oxide reductase subunit B
VGSVWGHGAYQAPDWSADWLHREAVALGAQTPAPAGLDADAGAAVVADRVRRELRANGYDSATGTLTVSEARARAVAEVSKHYDALFGGDRAWTGSVRTTPCPAARCPTRGGASS